MQDIIKILNNHGFKTIEGKESVLRAITEEAGPQSKPLCSGYRVFPDGRKCLGCSDCHQTTETIYWEVK